MPVLTDEVEYGARGTLGLLVPQANTTAEPEVQAMLDTDIALLTGRLTSPQPEMKERLGDFLTGIDDFITTFANAPLSGLGFLITGSTYHLTPDQEDAHFDTLSARYGYPIVSAAQSIRRAFKCLSAKRIALVSPYPDWLTQKSIAYWKRCGVEICAVEAPDSPGGFHNIYMMRNDEVLSAAKRLLAHKPDLILLAGAGMPTLGPIMALADLGMPAISSNFCMAWQINQMAKGASDQTVSLNALLQKDAMWRNRLIERFPGVRPK
jgi:maleate cis-trans isomerase